MASWLRVRVGVCLALWSVGTAASVKLPSEFPIPPAAPPWELPDLESQRHHLQDYRGRWVLVHFWATWCGPCVEELPSLDRLRSQTGKALAVLAINVGEPVATITATVNPLGIGLPILRDADSQVSGKWQVQGLPTTYLVNPEGQIVGGAIGTREWDHPLIRHWILEKVDADHDRTE